MINFVDFTNERSLGVGPKPTGVRPVAQNAGPLQHFPAFGRQEAAAETQLLVVLLQTLGADVFVLNVTTFHFELHALMLKITEKGRGKGEIEERRRDRMRNNIIKINDNGMPITKTTKTMTTKQRRQKQR